MGKVRAAERGIVGLEQVVVGGVRDHRHGRMSIAVVGSGALLETRINCW